MKKLYGLIGISLAGSLAVTAHAATVDFSGYFRAGTGINSRGGQQTCYQLPGADTKWRLGNECDYTIEPNFNANLAKLQDGSEWHVHFMPSVYRAWGQVENGTDELTTRFGQVYAYGANIPQLAGGTVWAGRRFYNRLQLGINDQFLERYDGDGAGIENMDLGWAKLSLAFMLDPRANGADPNNNRYGLPFRLTNIKTFKDSELSIYTNYEKQTKSKDQNTLAEPNSQKTGNAIGIYHRTDNVLGGSFLVGARYDKNETARGGLGQKNTRLVFQQTGLTGRTAWDLIGEYRIRKFDDASLNPVVNSAKETWYSLGARTDTHISGPFRFLVELGHDRIKPDGAPTRNMTKLTIAGAISAGPDSGSRPTFRLFYTYAKWNGAARDVLGKGWINETRNQEVFGDKTSGSSVGVQAEAWW